MLKVLKGSLPRLITWWISLFSIKRILALFILVYSSYGHDQKDNLESNFSDAALGKFGGLGQENYRNKKVDNGLPGRTSNLFLTKTTN